MPPGASAGTLRVTERVGVAERVTLAVRDGEAEALGVPLGVSDMDGVELGVTLNDGVTLAVELTDTVAAMLALTVLVGVGDAEPEGVGAMLAVPVLLLVGEGLRLGVPLPDGLPLGVRDALGEGLGTMHVGKLPLQEPSVVEQLRVVAAGMKPAWHTYVITYAMPAALVCWEAMSTSGGSVGATHALQLATRT